MIFETQYAYYMQNIQSAQSVYVWKCTSHPEYVMEIGTGSLIAVDDNVLYREDTTQHVSKLMGTLYMNGMDIRSGQYPLITATAFRMKWLNPFDKVEIKMDKGNTNEIIFPNSVGYRHYEDRFFINALVPYTCISKRRGNTDESEK